MIEIVCSIVFFTFYDIMIIQKYKTEDRKENCPMPRFLHYFGYVLMPLLPFAFVFALIFSIKFLLEDDKNFLYFAIAASIFLLLILCGL